MITPRFRLIFWTAGLFFLAAHGGHAWAADAAAGNGASGSGRAEALLVGQLVILMVTGRLLGEGMQRIGQPALMGQLLAGILLGPSLFGWIWPAGQHFIFPGDAAQKGMIDGISQVGILLLLLLTGMETDLRLVRKSGFASIAIALCGIAFPFAAGFALGQFGPAALFGQGDRLVTSLFLGTAMSISSIKIVATVVREMNFMRRNLGQVIVATAIMEDTAGWVIIAITFGIAGARGAGIDWWDVGRTLAGVALFMVFCLTAGRWLVFTAIRWANDSFRSEFPVITMILVIMGVFALITHLLGVRDVLGAFMAGVLIGESPILTGHIQQQLRGMITAFFMPVFFALSGLSADLTILKSGEIALLTAGLIAVASIGKFTGAFAGSLLGRLTLREGVALGCAMNARGSTEVIVASIGLSMGALTGDLYTMIVTMALVTTMAMPPMLRGALSRIPMTKEEETRIEREAIDARGFVPALERLLLAVDDSATGRMAARLAGLVAGGQGMPVTILRLDADMRDAGGDNKGESGSEKQKKQPGKKGHAERSVEREAAKEEERKEITGAQVRKTSGAELREDPLAREVITGARHGAAKVIADASEPDPDHVHVTQLVPVDAPADVVRDEARKGYDLLFIGLDDGVGEDGRFAPKLTQIASRFEGPLAVLAHSDEKVRRLSGRSRILVPVNGSGPSRRAAEFAFALARGTGARVQCLFVSQSDGRSRTRVLEEGVLRDMAELAERYDVSLATRISARGQAADAIVREARRNFALVVMGASARPGDELYFGNTAGAVMQGAELPVLILAT